jgi:hypothetical protein
LALDVIGLFDQVDFLLFQFLNLGDLALEKSERLSVGLSIGLDFSSL